MSAIITDQFRILSAENFITQSESSSYYAFVGLTNSTEYDSDWEDTPPSPIDSLDNFNQVWDTIIALKKINSSDIKRVVPKKQWESGTTYDMYRHDISRDKLSIPGKSTSLYSSNYYVMNSDFRVYICLKNGIDPDNPLGKPSIDEPKFTDLEPREAGTSGDGYVWKYLYTISPVDIIKFDALFYMPVPDDWGNDAETSLIKDNASSTVSGQIKTVLIKNRGESLGNPKTYTDVPIVGDGTGATATIVVGQDLTVEDVFISSGGSGYTYGVVDINAAGVNITGTTLPQFDVIIPPPGGHGFDIYRELGAKNVLIYSRIENDNLDPDFITGNKIARIGLVKDPVSFASTEVISKQKVSNTYALKLTGDSPDDIQNAVFPANSVITQTQVGTGYTAVGRVINYDNRTGVLKYWQDRSVSGFATGPLYELDNPEIYSQTQRFISSDDLIVGESSSLGINTTFSGITTVGGINNQTTFNLGQEFSSGLSNPEVKKYSGEMIYIDNRPSITRSINQKEDIKIVLQF